MKKPQVLLDPPKLFVSGRWNLAFPQLPPKQAFGVVSPPENSEKMAVGLLDGNLLFLDSEGAAKPFSDAPVYLRSRVGDAQAVASALVRLSLPAPREGSGLCFVLARLPGGEDLILFDIAYLHSDNDGGLFTSPALHLSTSPVSDLDRGAHCFNTLRPNVFTHLMSGGGLLHPMQLKTVLWRCREGARLHIHVKGVGPFLVDSGEVDEAVMSGGRFVVLRADGTAPPWPSFVLGAKDPAASAALRAYALEVHRLGMDADYARGVLDLADTFEDYAQKHGESRPDTKKPLPH